jgi:acetyl-CoA synthetase
VLNRVHGVRESAAIAVPPPGGGPSRLVVFVVSENAQQASELSETPDVQVTANEAASQLRSRLQATIRNQLNPLFHIHEVVIVESLPRTASNKVMRRELRAQYRDN